MDITRDDGVIIRTSNLLEACQSEDWFTLPLKEAGFTPYSIPQTVEFTEEERLANIEHCKVLLEKGDLTSADLYPPTPSSFSGNIIPRKPTLEELEYFKKKESETKALKLRRDQEVAMVQLEKDIQNYMFDWSTEQLSKTQLSSGEIEIIEEANNYQVVQWERTIEAKAKQFTYAWFGLSALPLFLLPISLWFIPIIAFVGTLSAYLFSDKKAKFIDKMVEDETNWPVFVKAKGLDLPISVKYNYKFGKLQEALPFKSYQRPTFPSNSSYPSLTCGYIPRHFCC